MKMETEFKDKWIPIFKTGIQTDSAGRQKEWTEEELDEMVQNTEQFPLVLGHPKEDASSPAYGWSKKLKRDGNTLYANHFEQIAEGFPKAIKNGNWPNRSVRIIRKEKGYAIAHLGWLGATAPAIDLPPVYSTNVETVFYDYDYQTQGDFMSEDSNDLNKKVEGLAASIEILMQRFEAESDAKPPESNTTIPPEFAQRLQHLETRNQQLERQSTLVEINASLEKRLLPAQQPKIIAQFMVWLSEQETSDFAKNTKQTNLAWFEQNIIKELEKARQGLEQAEFAAPEGNKNNELNPYLQQLMDDGIIPKGPQ